MKSILPTKLSVLFTLGVAALPIRADDISATTQVIAVSGEAAPDGNGVFGAFNGFNSPVLGARGQVTFNAYFVQTAGGSADDSGLCVFSSGQLATLAREGQVAPFGNSVFFSIASASLSGAGQAVFNAYLSPAGGAYAGDVRLLRFAGPGSYYDIARVGQASPDGNGTISGFLDRSAPNASGQSAFSVRFAGAPGAGTNDSGILLGDGSAPPTMVARVNQIPPGGNSAFYYLGSTALNDAGQVAFQAYLDSPDVIKPTGIYLADGDSIAPIVQSGQAAPGGNGTFASVEHIGLSATGKVSILANLAGTSGGSTDNIGVYVGDGDGPMAEVARKGQPGPGSSGTILELSNYAPVTNGPGQMAFVAIFQTGVENGHAVLRTTQGGELQEVLRGGTASPDGNGRVVFSTPALNNTGQMAFFGIATDTSGGIDDFGAFAGYSDVHIIYNAQGLGEIRDRIILFYDDQLGLLKVAREGDPLLGSTISQLYFAGGGLLSSGAGNAGTRYYPVANGNTGMNDAGQVAYSFTLADGRSGIALWSSPAAPTGEIAVTDVSRTGANLTILFSTVPGVTEWAVEGSPDLKGFPDNLTDQSTITELSPGNYQAIIDVSAVHAAYFVRIGM